MTAADLVFIIVALGTLAALLRAASFLVRRRAHDAVRVLRRLAIGAGVYLGLIAAVSVVQPKRTIGPGVPQCFDEFCVAVDSAVRQSSLGAVRADGDFLVVSARVLNRGRGRRQRETDVYAVLLDDRGGRHLVSETGQTALRLQGRSGAALQDFVDAGASNDVRLAFDVPKDASSFEFVTAHGWFPGALIIGASQSLFHRSAVVPLVDVVRRSTSE